MANSIPINPAPAPDFTTRFLSHLIQWIESARLDRQIMRWHSIGAPPDFPFYNISTEFDPLLEAASDPRYLRHVWSHPYFKPYRRACLRDYFRHAYTYQYQPYEVVQVDTNRYFVLSE